MGKQLYYEDVEPGTPLPPLIKTPNIQQLVKWAAASGDYNQIHYDKYFAISMGLPGVIVHGLLTASFLGQMITDWIGDGGKLKKLSCSYRGMLFPGQTITCRGKVSKKYIQEAHYTIECETWSENPKGEAVVLGKATIILLSRARSREIN